MFRKLISPSQNSQNIILTALYFLITALISLYLFSLPYNLDTSWLTYVARKVLGGKTLYIDLAETNPPLIIWLNMIAVHLSPSAGYDIKIYNLLTLIAGYISIFASYTIAKKSEYLDNNKAIFFLFFITIVVFISAAGNWVFGQREHLFIIFTLPYLIYSNPEIFSKIKLSKPQLILLGSWAAIGFLLKPYFLILFIFLELFLLIHLRKVHISRLIIGITIFVWGCIYLLSTYLLHTPYFTEILPDLIRTYEGHLMRTSIIIRRFKYEVIILIPLIPFFILFHKKLLKPQVLFGIVLLFSYIAIAAIQFKGWVYSYYPIRVGIYFLLFLCLRELLCHLPKHRVIRYKALIVAFSIAITAVLSQKHFHQNILLLLIVGIPLLAHSMLELKLALSRSLRQSWYSYLYIASLITISVWLLNLSIFSFTHHISVQIIYFIMLLYACWPLLYQVKPSLLQSYRKSIFFYSCATIIIASALFNFNRSFNAPSPTEKFMVYTLYNEISEMGVSSIYLFNTNLYPAFPLTSLLQVEWGARYHHLWMLPTLYKRGLCVADIAYADIEKRLFERLYSDLKKSKPDLLIFDDSIKAFLNRAPYKFNKCMRKDPKLNSIFKQYKRVSKLYYCSPPRAVRNCAYSIYKRKDFQPKN